MRLLVILAAAAAALWAGTSPSRADGPWCATLSGGRLGSAENCGFYSWEQCQAYISGIGGFCHENALYEPPRMRTKPHPRARRHIRHRRHPR